MVLFANKAMVCLTCSLGRHPVVHDQVMHVVTGANARLKDFEKEAEPPRCSQLHAQSRHLAIRHSHPQTNMRDRFVSFPFHLSVAVF
jgi:hypothetical protein